MPISFQAAILGTFVYVCMVIWRRDSYIPSNMESILKLLGFVVVKLSSHGLAVYPSRSLLRVWSGRLREMRAFTIPHPIWTNFEKLPRNNSFELLWLQNIGLANPLATLSQLLECSSQSCDGQLLWKVSEDWNLCKQWKNSALFCKELLHTHECLLWYLCIKCLEFKKQLLYRMTIKNNKGAEQCW